MAKGGEMSQPDFGRPANASGAWPYSEAEPYGAPEPFPGYADPGTGTPGSDTQPYDEWHHAGAVPGDSGSWGLPQEDGPAPDWPGEGTYVPGDDDGQPPWGGSSRPAPYGAPPSPGTAGRHHRPPSLRRLPKPRPSGSCPRTGGSTTRPMSSGPIPCWAPSKPAPATAWTSARTGSAGGPTHPTATTSPSSPYAPRTTFRAWRPMPTRAGSWPG